MWVVMWQHVANQIRVIKAMKYPEDHTSLNSDSGFQSYNERMEVRQVT